MKTFFQNMYRYMKAVPQRFPLPTVALLSIFGCGAYFVYHDYERNFIVSSCMVACTAFFWMSVSVDVWTYAQKIASRTRWMTQIIVFTLSVLYGIAVFSAVNTQLCGALYEQHVMWHICFFLCILFAPFLWALHKKHNIPVFTHAVAIIQSLGIAFVFCWSVMILGSLLFGSLTILFDIDLMWFAEYCMMFVSTVVSPMIFLAYLPSFSYKKDDSVPDHRIVHVFVMSVLLPFIIGYFVILYAYTGKIIITWQWPNGGVSWLILVFSIIGWIAYYTMFLWQPKAKIVSLFFALFPYVAVPQIAVLAIAVWWRIDAYGLTMHRYLCVAVGVWLLLVGLHAMIFRNRQKIIMAPVFLVCIILCVTVGPWSARNVAERSQVERLRVLVEEHHLVRADGTADADAGKNLPQSVQNVVHTQIAYIVETHGMRAIEKVFPVVVQNVYTEREIDPSHSICMYTVCEDYELIDAIQTRLGVEYAYNIEDISQDHTFDFNQYDSFNKRGRQNMISVTGYDYSVSDIMYYATFDDDEKWSMRDVCGKEMELKVVKRDNKPFVVIMRDNTEVDRFDMEAIAQHMFDVRTKRPFQAEDFVHDLHGSEVDARVISII